jgi:hypothetical protein
MDDGLVLNLATDDFASLTKTTQGKKGGRWTDRYVFPSLFLGSIHMLVLEQRQKESPNEKVDQGRRLQLRLLTTRNQIVLRKELAKSLLNIPPFLCKLRHILPVLHKVLDHQHK